MFLHAFMAYECIQDLCDVVNVVLVVLNYKVEFILKAIITHLCITTTIILIQSKG